MAETPAQPDAETADAAETNEPAAAGLVDRLKALPQLVMTRGRAGIAAARQRLQTAEPLRQRADLWPIPAFVLGLALIGFGVSTWIERTPEADFRGAFDDIEFLIQSQRFDEALEVLDHPIGAFILTDVATMDDRERFYTLMGDALFLGQEAEGVSVHANNLAILDAYMTARNEFLADLSPERRHRVALTQYRLGNTNAAIAEARDLPPEGAEFRRDIFRRIIADAKADPTESGLAETEIMRLLTDMRTDPATPPDDRIWAITQQTRIRLARGYAEQAIARLLPELNALPSRFAPETGELFVLLGRAYFEIGRTDSAEEHLQHALDLLPQHDSAFGEAEVTLARVAQARGETEEARDRFRAAAARFPETEIALQAHIGLGEVEAELANHKAAIDAFREAVLSVRRGDPGADRLRGQLEASLGQQFDRMELEGDAREALRYATLAEQIYEPDRTPPDAVERIARTHRALAESLLEGVPETVDGLPDLTLADPVTVEEARSHFYRSARNYRRHARMMTLVDPDIAAASLWNAADGFDRAGDQERAKQAFSEFVQTRPDDPMRVEAQYRLARVNQARGEYQAAVELFESILGSDPTSIWAYRSYVPLSQCYLLLSGDGDADKAEARLRAVIDGQFLGPDAPEFRLALVELGLLYRRTGRFPEAIETLNEAINRYPELTGESKVGFALARSLHGSARDIAATLEGNLPQSERVRLSRLRTERLLDALEQYNQVHASIEAKVPTRRTDLEQEILRDVTFYRGDCAYDLGKHHGPDTEVGRQYFGDALRYYDAAAQRYASDAASLVAMVQIVNCHAAMGNWREAQTAQARARARLNELPDDAFTRSDLPMNRDHWEEWLESSIRLERMASADPAG